MEELQADLWHDGKYDGLRFFEGPDPVEMERNRRRMLVYLARYGRTPPSEWLDEDISEMIAFHQALSDMVGEERSLTSEV